MGKQINILQGNESYSRDSFGLQSLLFLLLFLYLEMRKKLKTVVRLLKTNQKDRSFESNI